MESCLHSIFILNKEFVSSCDFNPDIFHRNDNIYEVVRVMQGHILFLDEHVQRLMLSAKNMGYNPALQPELIKKSLIKLVSLNRVDSGNIKVVLTEKKDDVPYAFAAWFIPHAYPDADMYAGGVSVSLLMMERNRPNTKLQNNAYKKEVSEHMKQEQVYEVLLTRNGEITEGSRSNVFFVKQNCIHTAPDHTVLKGITREKLLEICGKLEIPVKLEAVRTKNLGQFEACFLSGTSPKVLPVAEIKGLQRFQPAHPLIKSISKQYDIMLAEQVGTNVHTKTI